MIRPADLLRHAVTVAALATAAAMAAGCGAETAPEPPGIPPLPPTLSATGLFADAATRTPAPGVRPFAPQYPLWTDGAAKQRWIRLPAGAAIDATDPDRWRFPAGTMLWKEFAFGPAARPQRVETRTIEKIADGTWRFAAYVWDADGREARLAPERGVPAAHEIRPGVFHDVPGRLDCLACHGGREEPVLGFSALQLSPLRDALAPHAEAPAADALDLAALRAEGLLREAPCEVPLPPVVAARSPRERAALGYLHANCAACHRDEGPLAGLGLSFEVRLGEAGHARTMATALDREARYRPNLATAAWRRLVAGAPHESLLVARAGSRRPALQMPPLGTRLVDEAALALLEGWIREDLAAPVPLPGPHSPVTKE
jgi:hypothetical protein